MEIQVISPDMKKIHFIAIGGSIMHQLAIALKEKGYRVTGSDDDFYEPALSNLKKHQLLPAPGWDADRITGDLDAVILGMHARAGNPELLKAETLGLPLYSFPEYIYEESRHKTRIVVGGSHGKTTITSMIMHVLKEEGKDFDFLAGAQIPGFDRSVKLSNAPLIVCEGDEYPASTLKKIPKFLFYHPHIAVLSGIAWDHINVFPTLDNYIEQFALFIRQLAPGSTLIYNATDETLTDLISREAGHLEAIPYYLPEFLIKNGTTRVTLNGATETLKIFGKHNLFNLQAAALVCQLLGISDAEFLSAIKSFEGASLRLQRFFENEQSVIFRDFAHAPSKVKASLQAVKDQFPERKLAAVLELHTYSSLNKNFLPQYAHAMDAADAAAVFFSPHALEIKKMTPITDDHIREGFANPQLKILHNATEVGGFIASQDSRQSNLLLMSSGNFEGLRREKILQLWQKIPDKIQ